MFRIKVNIASLYQRGMIFFIILPLFLLSSLSCNAQKRMVREAISQFKVPSVLLLYPEFIFKKNNNTKAISGFDSLTPDQQDSVAYYNSHFIQYIQDSIYLSVYIKSLVNELKDYGFNVYFENDLDTFLSLKEPAFVFSVAQLEIEEDVEPQMEEDIFDDTITYYKKFDLNIVRLNNWFELSRLNAEGGKPTVLFSTFFVEDQLDGHFWRHPLMLDVKYKYKLQEIRLEDVFGMANFAAQKNASYLYDYLFNQYYQQNQKDSIPDKRYWHYNRYQKNLRDAGDNKFILLDDQK